MKLKSFIAGAAGVFLFFAGQNLGAAEGSLPAPNQNTAALPVPDPHKTLPPPDPHKTLLPPDPHKTLPSPDPADALPSPAGSSSVSPEQAFRFPWPAGGGAGSSTGGPAPAGGQRAAAGSAGGSASGQRVAAGSAPAGGSAGGSASGQRAAAGSAGSPAGGTRVVPSTTPAAAAPRRSLPPRGVYLGAMAGFATSEYNTKGTDWDDTGGGNIDNAGGGSLGLFLGADSGFLIGEVGALLSFDNAEMFSSISMKGISLHIPLLVKMDLHLGPVVLQPLAGPYFNFALGDLDMGGYGKDPYANPPIGLVFGGLVGLNLGRGFFFIDSRYEMDLGKTVAGNNPMTIWQRSAFIMNFGYQIYLGRTQ